jgi:hypothetical protein
MQKVKITGTLNISELKRTAEQIAREILLKGNIENGR